MNDTPFSSESVFAEQFPVNENVHYLNHAAVAPWPECAREAVQRFATENVQTGATHYPEWIKEEKSLRDRLAKLIGTTHTDSVALVKNTSEALSVVAYGIDWNPGDVIVISNDEFPSNRIVWESLTEKFGVEVRQVSIEASDPEKHFIQAIEDGARLISVSAVQYASGIRLDLKKLGKSCREHNTLYCVDAIQAVGAMPFHCDEWEVDFAMADGHKWMLGPEGLGFFFVRQDKISTLKLHQYGWHMIEHAGDYSRTDWTPASSAQRFECGSPNMLGCYALNASIGLLLDAGLGNVRSAIEERHDYLRTELISMGAEILTPDDPEIRAGILTFRLEGIDSAVLYRTLMERKVICANRGGGVRFSPHFHTPKASINNALNILKDVIAELKR